MPLVISKSKIGQPAQPASPKQPEPKSLALTAERLLKRRPHSLLHLATRLFNQPLMIQRRKLDVILMLLGPRLGVHTDLIPQISLDVEPEEEPTSELSNGLAVIPIYGTLVKRAMPMDAMSGMTSYEDLRTQIDTAMADPNCQGLLFDVDSPGGESAGMFELADYIYSLRGEKPMYSISNDSMYSAAYGIASAADQCYITNVGGAGSIGVYMLHVDQSERDKMAGLKYTYISSGDRKTDGNPHEALSDPALEAAQAEVDRQRQMFVDLVARNRGLDTKKVFDTEAAVYHAGDACDMGLCDMVGSMEDSIDQMEELFGSASRSRVPMTGTGAGTGARSASKLTKPGASILAGAIGAHKTATTDGAWDGPANEARLKSDQTASYYRKEYAWVDSDKDATKKNAYKFPHHEVSGSGDIGAANVKACQSIIGSLNGARGGTVIPGADRKGVYNHAAKHLRDAGVEPPELKSEADALQVAMGSVHELDDNPVATVAVLYSLVGGPVNALTHRYEGSDIELHVRHFAATAQVQTTARTITCCVAPYNQMSSDLGGYKEVYAPGCFSECLKADDPRALFNHNPDYVLGRKSAGTARFIEREDGLYFEADAPDTQWANDLLVSMRRGDITQGSAAFFILKPRWEYRGAQKIRVIEQAKLVESSVASFAAYESSTASVGREVAAQQEQLAMRLRLLAL
jgi:HK97 family phage prohead protease